MVHQRENADFQGKMMIKKGGGVQIKLIGGTFVGRKKLFPSVFRV